MVDLIVDMDLRQASTECMKALLGVLTHDDAFGPMGNWGLEIFSTMGIILGTNLLCYKTLMCFYSCILLRFYFQAEEQEISIY